LDVTNSVALTNGHFQVTVPSTASTAFYRLKLQRRQRYNYSQPTFH